MQLSPTLSGITAPLVTSLSHEATTEREHSPTTVGGLGFTVTSQHIYLAARRLGLAPRPPFVRRVRQLLDLLASHRGVVVVGGEGVGKTAAWRTLQAAIAEAVGPGTPSSAPVTVTHVYPDALSVGDLLGWRDATGGGGSGTRWRDGVVSQCVRRSGQPPRLAGVAVGVTGGGAVPSGGADDDAGPNKGATDESVMNWLVLDGGEGGGVAGSERNGVVGSSAVVEESLLGILDAQPTVTAASTDRLVQPVVPGSLILPSGERVQSGLSLRVLFETTSLSNASPATISRCGILHVDPQVRACRQRVCVVPLAGWRQ